MPDFCPNFCLDDVEGECLCHFCHDGDGIFHLVKKYTEMVSSKKYSHRRLVKIYRNGTKKCIMSIIIQKEVSKYVIY